MKGIMTFIGYSVALLLVISVLAFAFYWRINLPLELSNLQKDNLLLPFAVGFILIIFGLNNIVGLKKKGCEKK